jgi:hypothetical protein
MQCGDAAHCHVAWGRHRPPDADSWRLPGQAEAGWVRD